MQNGKPVNKKRFGFSNAYHIREHQSKELENKLFSFLICYYVTKAIDIFSLSKSNVC